MAPRGVRPRVEYSFDRQNWFEHSAGEHRAARERVALFDQTSFSKYVLRGSDAAAVLQRLCANDVDVEPGRVVYTALLNDRGGYESDLTVARIAGDEFYIVTGTGQMVRDRHWIESRRPAGSHAALVDVTSAWSVLGLMGPRARDVLRSVTDADVGNEAFPFAHWREVLIESAPVRALRVTYVGELGWELHVPAELATRVFDALVEAGRDSGLAIAGHYAINSLRLEKAYRAWGADISPSDTPLEAGLAFTVAWEKPVEFIGKKALVAARLRGVRRRLASFVLEDPGPVLWGSEPIFRDGASAGHTTSGAYGHTLGASVALGYVEGDGAIDRDWVRAGRYEIEVGGDRFPARVFLNAPYDPERRKVLC
jgi:4-methylaminobutanoate oxidase (formaldehyde-forming)